MVPSSYFFPSRLSSVKLSGTGRTDRPSMSKQEKVFQIFLKQDQLNPMEVPDKSGGRPNLRESRVG